MNKGKLIITVGISGSGKSTWAHEKWLEDSDNYTIVNRDKIRELLFGYTEESIAYYYEKPHLVKYEKQVTRYEDTLIHEGLNHGKTVIVDATNLLYKYLERFKYWNVATEVIVFDIDYDVAIARDLARYRAIGDSIINRQQNRFNTLTKQLLDNPIDFTPTTITMNGDNEPCVIFDIDGTLAHMNRDTRSPYDWHKVGEDSLDLGTACMSYAVDNAGYKVVICTGRDAVCLPETERWLDDNNILYSDILIRSLGDQRADWIVKEEMWRGLAEDYNIIGMFDDRLQVVRRARALGLKVFNVEYNNF